MSRHRTPEELEAFRAGKAGLLRGWFCRFHLRGCARCRRKLEELHQDERFLGEITRELDAYDRMLRDLEEETERKTDSES